MRWLKQYAAISKNAFVVSLSDPVFLILVLLSLSLMAFFASLPTYNFGDAMRLIRDQNLALIFMGGCIIATIGVVTILTRDLEGGAISVLMSRPVSGWTVMAGKLSGLGLAILVYHLIMTVAALWMSKIAGEEVSQQNLDARGLQLYFGSVILALAVMAVKHYFFGGWYVWQANLALLLIFTLGFIFALSTDAHDESWGSGVDWRSFYGTLLIFPAELLFAAIMVPIAVKFRSAMVFGCGAALFLLGMVSQFLGTKFLGSGAISVALKSLIPNWQIFWISDLLGQRDELLVSQVSSYALHCFIHSLSYIVCCVIVATIIFNRRELYGQDTT